MVDSLPAESPPLARPAAGSGPSSLDRIASFRFTYAAIFAFALLYVVTLRGAVVVLDGYFRDAVAEAVRVSPADGPVVPQIQRNVRRVVRGSAWARLGEVQVDTFVVGADGTVLYPGGGAAPPPDETDPVTVFLEAARLLPARTEVVVSVAPTSLVAIGILVGYGAILITTLFFYNRKVVRREAALVHASVAARDATAMRAREIEAELDQVRRRLGQVEPSERAHTQEIRDLEREREGLRRKLGELAEREGELRQSAARSLELEQERQALEELLEEAMDDLTQKEGEIQGLQDRLRRADRAAPRASSKSRAAEQLGRRMRTLYKNLEFDDRAITDLVALRDETMRLKAEEGIKRLSDDAENASIRRKVGGLPPQLSIFELGFAGKGRLYYTRGRTLRFRVLAIGAKNTQKTDLEYLSRLSAD